MVLFVVLLIINFIVEMVYFIMIVNIMEVLFIFIMRYYFIVVDLIDDEFCVRVGFVMFVMFMVGFI